MVRHSLTMLIPKPLDVDALIRKAKKGKLITVSEIRSRLARDNNVERYLSDHANG